MSTKAVELITSRLVIRDPKMSDFDGWLELLTDKVNLYYLDDICANSAEEVRARLQEAVNQAHNPDRTQYFLTAEIKETGEFIGSTGYTVIKETPAGKNVHAGYFYLSAYHGKGYATEALRAVMDYAFQDGGVYYFKTGLFADNKASERVMIKCGLIKETDYLEKAWHDGRIKERLSYSLLKSAVYH